MEVNNRNEVRLQIKTELDIKSDSFYQLINSKNELLDQLLGSDIVETLNINNWKDFFDYYKEALPDRQTFIILKINPKEPTNPGIAVYSFTKSFLLSKTHNMKKPMESGLQGLSELMSGMNETNSIGLSALQDELVSKNSQIQGLNDQIIEGYKTVDQVREEAKRREVELLDIIKNQEIKIRDLENKLEREVWQLKTEARFNDQLQKAQDNNMGQYIPMIMDGISKIPFGSPAPSLSGTQRVNVQNNQNVESSGVVYDD